MFVTLLHSKGVSWMMNSEAQCMWSSAFWRAGWSMSYWGTDFQHASLPSSCHRNSHTSETHQKKKKILSEFINPNNLWTNLISLVVGFPVLLLPFGGQILVLRRSELFHTWSCRQSQFHHFISILDLLPWLLLADRWGCEYDVPQLPSYRLSTYTSGCHRPQHCYIRLLFAGLVGGKKIFLLKVSSHVEYSSLCRCPECDLVTTFFIQ